MELKIRSAEREHGEPRKLTPFQPTLFGEGEALPALVVEGCGARRIIPLEYLRRAAYRGRTMGAETVKEPRLPCVFVSQDFLP